MKKAAKILLFTLSWWSLSSFGQADDQSALHTDDAYASGAFLNYDPYIKEAPKSSQKKVPSPKQETAPSTPKEEKVTMEWLKKNYEILQLRSMNNPTPENLSAEAYARRIAFDKAQNYAVNLVEATKQDPLLDENNRIPYASAGATAVRNADLLAQESALKELSQKGGLVVFVDSSCRFCAMQMPVIDLLKKMYGIDALVVSLDGTSPKGYKGAIQRDNGLYRKLGLKLTPSIVYVNEPKPYKPGTKDPNEYSIVSQGFYAVDELTKQIAYAAYRRGYLSAEVKSNLDVWKRGVASTEDLNSLTLDVNNPASFQKKIAPILQKQY